MELRQVLRGPYGDNHRTGIFNTGAKHESLENTPICKLVRSRWVSMSSELALMAIEKFDDIGHEV